MKNYKKFIILMVVIVLISSLFSLLSPFLISYWKKIGHEITRVNNMSIAIAEIVAIFLSILAILLPIVIIYLLIKFAKK